MNCGKKRLFPTLSFLFYPLSELHRDASVEQKACHVIYLRGMCLFENAPEVCKRCQVTRQYENCVTPDLFPHSFVLPIYSDCKCLSSYLRYTGPFSRTDLTHRWTGTWLNPPAFHLTLQRPTAARFCLRNSYAHCRPSEMTSPAKTKKFLCCQDSGKFSPIDVLLYLWLVR